MTQKIHIFDNAALEKRLNDFRAVPPKSIKDIFPHLQTDECEVQPGIPHDIKLVVGFDVDPNNTQIAELINLVRAHPHCAVVKVHLYCSTEGPLPGLAAALASCSQTLTKCFCQKNPGSLLLPLLEAQDNVLTWVSFGWSWRDDDDAQRLVAALGRQSSMECVKIYDIPASGSNLVAELIRHSPLVKGFHLFTSAGFDLDPIFAALESHTSVEYFRQSAPGPVPSEKEAKALVALLETQFTLTDYSIDSLQSPYRYNVSLAKWPKIGFYLGLNQNGRAQIWATQLTSHNQWIEHLAGKDQDGNDRDGIDVSSIFYYLEKKGPDILDFKQFLAMPLQKKRPHSAI